MDELDTAWLAGWLEGEGCFSIRKIKQGSRQYDYPIVTASSTDFDTLERVQSIAGGKIYEARPQNPNHSMCWRWQLYGKDEATSLMLTLLPLMSKRRRERIQEVLETAVGRVDCG